MQKKALSKTLFSTNKFENVDEIIFYKNIDYQIETKTSKNADKPIMREYHEKEF